MEIVKKINEVVYHLYRIDVEALLKDMKVISEKSEFHEAHDSQTMWTVYYLDKVTNIKSSFAFMKFDGVIKEIKSCISDDKDIFDPKYRPDLYKKILMFLKRKITKKDIESITNTEDGFLLVKVKARTRNTTMGEIEFNKKLGRTGNK